MRIILFGFLILIFIQGKSDDSTQVLSKPLKGFMDYNIYYDSRGFSVYTLNLLGKINPQFTYFSLTNYEGPSGSSEMGTFYSEHDLFWTPLKEKIYDFSFQYVIRNGVYNDDYRLGVRFKFFTKAKDNSFAKKIGLYYSINPMFIEFRPTSGFNTIPVIEHVYRFKPFPKLFKNKLYVAGFGDQNIQISDSGTKINWVTEHQIGYQALKDFYLVSEYRINEFMSEITGWGFGIQYKLLF